MPASPFLCVSWSRPFIPALVDLALLLTDNDPGRAYFVFPHARPALYLTEALRTDSRVAKPCVLPRMDSVAGLFSRMRAGVATPQATPVGMLDQVALLLQTVRALREERGGLLGALPLDDSRRFFPWGVRLAALMEEFMAHGRVPEDYTHMEGQAAPFATALLEHIGAIYERYIAALDQRGWTTPGLDAFRVARALARTGDAGSLPFLEEKTIILAGFHTLTGAQSILFRHLWERLAATVCIQADPAVVSGSPHWSCTGFIRWAEAWRTRIHPLDPEDDNRGGEPAVSFRAGYDVHSQLGAFAGEMAASPEKEDTTAIVLPDTNLLLPVLHHLPNKDVNISMGYPLARSPLFRLTASILAMQEGRRNGPPHAYHWKAIIGIIRHPYLKMLSPLPGTDEEAPALSRAFRRFLHHAERTARGSQRFFPLVDFVARTREAYTQTEGTAPDPALEALFERILQSTVFAWEAVTTPDQLASALGGLVDLMHDHGAALWGRFPIDAECLYRLTESVIPQLAHTALCEEPLPRETLWEVLRQLLQSERVPFEAYPLVGTQIMGVLETRLLHFDRIIILDVTEDRLPGKGGHDPLLPDSLRPMAGLPGTREREKVAAYNFFRLVHGARNVTVYWQEGVEAQGLNDTKKIRSRFVEELLWREEQSQKRILSPEKPENAGVDGPFRLIPCLLPPIPRQRMVIPATAAVRQRLSSLLRGEISPSLLDTYLRCPALFFRQRIGRIREVEGAAEGRDPQGVGLFLHDVLRSWFAARPGLAVTADPTSIAAMHDHFHACLANSPLRKTLPADDRVMLEEAGPPILFTLLQNHEGRVPLHLEEKFSAPLMVNGEPRTLAGYIDRVDDEEGFIRVMDYKTGTPPDIKIAAWHDETLWQSLAAWQPGSDGEELEALAEWFPSIQLPAYMHIYSAHTRRLAHDALYVPLRTDAKDIPLIGDDADLREREEILREKIPTLLSFLLRHMEQATSFPPRPGAHCGWCLYATSCTVMPR